MSECDHCGGHVSPGFDASNRCESCGRRNAVERATLPLAVGIDDSEIVALRADVARLGKELKALKTAQILLSRRSTETGPSCDF